MKELSSDTPTSNASRPQVFISYCHEPLENADFVRDLAGRLHVAGFAVWLDEEQLPAGASVQAEIAKAVQHSEVGIFVVTERWLTREWTQHEVRLFARRTDSRRLVILREEVELGDLGPHLAGLKTVTWLPPQDEKEDERDARFWEVYCGITNTPPGPRKDWSQKARNLTSSSPVNSNPAVPKENVPKKNNRTTLPCVGKPVVSFNGEHWTFVVTDADEWVGIAGDGGLHPPLARLGGHSTAGFSSSGELLVGMYEPIIARLRGERWQYLPQEAPVLCLGVCPDGDLAGTAAGGLVLMNGAPSTPFVRMRDPIIDMASFEGGILLLGSRGMFGKTTWPVDRESPLQWIQTGDLGRPVGFFKAVESDHVGIHSTTRVGVLNPITERITLCSRSFEDGIRQVVFLGAWTLPYAVLTDKGGLWLLEAGLGAIRPIRILGDEAVCGCSGLGSCGRVVVWTSRGGLYMISAHGEIEQIAGDGVVLACLAKVTDPTIDVVRWDANHGATMESIVM